MCKQEWDWHTEGVTAKLDLNSEEAKALSVAMLEHQERVLSDLARDVWGQTTETALTREDIESIRAEYDRLKARIDYEKRVHKGITKSLHNIWMKALYPDQKDEPLAQ